ncbi:olfactory receptor 6N2-like [Scophthalmus maximus]|uniref:olfactory receptor 6N2-like n=1 Tax=Scophthalmus maximus TaxID=52904 RepID=UPI0015E14D5D|nr:olfactory receptor 6N2-like [Scophthalmus maximus]
MLGYSLFMDGELNVTYITFDGYVELQKYRYFYFVIMFTIFMLIICSNSTIVCLIVIHKNLHEPMYIFIAALLINSLLYSITIYPKLLIDFLSETQITTFPHCIFQASMYYVLSTSEFLLLSAMAYDRYVSICKPLQYPTIMRGETVKVFLVSAWLIPSCELAVSVALYANIKMCHFSLKGLFCNTSLYTLVCVHTVVLSMYGVFILLTIVFLPVLFIIFTYTRIFIISFRSGKTVRTKAAQTCLPHLLVLINLSCFVSYDVIVVRLGSDLPKLARFILTLQMIVYHPLLNPFIYGLKMKEIYKHLKRLLFQV